MATQKNVFHIWNLEISDSESKFDLEKNFGEKISRDFKVQLWINWKSWNSEVPIWMIQVESVWLKIFPGSKPALFSLLFKPTLLGLLFLGLLC